MNTAEFPGYKKTHFEVQSNGSTLSISTVRDEAMDAVSKSRGPNILLFMIPPTGLKHVVMRRRNPFPHAKLRDIFDGNEMKKALKGA